MSLQFITGDDGHTALYDTVSEWAFGPVFSSPENAEAFCVWAEVQGVKNGDVRRLPLDDLAELSDRYFHLGGER